MTTKQHIQNLKDLIELVELSNDKDVSVAINHIDLKSIQILLKEYEKQEKRIDELENHIHYKTCKACGKEFKAKRNDAKYCTYCSRVENNRSYYLSLTEEQKAKRREQAKQSMRKLRASKKGE